MSDHPGDLKRTPLYDAHVAAGARIVPFAGYEMPVQYAGENGGVLAEHRWTREHAGLFDVSHMGLSPWYRGSSCNFWALNDGRPDLVGATIHRLSRGLDSGDMLYHARPPVEATDPFVFGMKAVKAAHDSLIERIASGEIATMTPVVQDRGQELRYTRNRDFDDAAAEAYLAAAPTPEGLKRALETAPPMPFLRLHQPAPLDS